MGAEDFFNGHAQHRLVVVQVAPVVGRQVGDGETESHAAFAARLWRTARAPRIEFEGALFKGGSNYGESEFFGLSSSVPNRSIQTKVGSTFRLFYNLAEFALRLVFRSA